MNKSHVVEATDDTAGLNDRTRMMDYSDETNTEDELPLDYYHASL